jgi:hypothetical protein
MFTPLRSLTLCGRGTQCAFALTFAVTLAVFLCFPPATNLGEDGSLETAVPSPHRVMLERVQRVLEMSGLDATTKMNMISDLVQTVEQGDRITTERAVDALNEARVVAIAAPSGTEHKMLVHPVPAATDPPTSVLPNVSRGQMQLSPSRDRTTTPTPSPIYLPLSSLAHPSLLRTSMRGQTAPMCTATQMQSRLVSASSAAQNAQPLLAERRYNSGCSAIGRNYKCRSSTEYTAFLADPSRRQVTMASDFVNPFGTTDTTLLHDFHRFSVRSDCMCPLIRIVLPTCSGCTHFKPLPTPYHAPSRWHALRLRCPRPWPTAVAPC